MLSETDKAWMAGFVDGEGCITIARQSRIARPSDSIRVQITLSNTNRDVLGSFSEAYGGNVYNVHERRKDKNNVKWADAWDWHCPMFSNSQILTDLLPYLRLKHRQAELCLEYLATRTNTKLVRHVNGRIAGSTPLTDEEIDKREEYRIAVQSLNTKGRRARALIKEEGDCQL